MSSTTEEDTKLDDAWLIDTPHALLIVVVMDRQRDNSMCF